LKPFKPEISRDNGVKGMPGRIGRLYPLRLVSEGGREGKAED
jgi:hypothetical protein